MNRAALFFDIDGTVLSEITKEIPASTVDALKRAHDAGHFLFINTGRTYCSVPVELKKLPFDGYLCGCGIYFTFDEEIIFEKHLDKFQILFGNTEISGIIPSFRRFDGDFDDAVFAACISFYCMNKRHKFRMLLLKSGKCGFQFCKHSKLLKVKRHKILLYNSIYPLNPPRV